MLRGDTMLSSMFYIAPIIAAAVFLYLAVGCLIVTKKKWWSRIMVLFGCWLLVAMIIFIGDWANLPPTLLAFLFCLWFGCEGSALKRIVIGMMVASTVFAFNGFHDNCFSELFYPHSQNYYGAILRMLFNLLLYLGIRSRRPEPDFELSKPLWKLMLMLNCMPLGVVLSLVLFRNPYFDGGDTLLADAALFLVAVFSFAGLFAALLVLERQQRLERETLLARHNRQYYEAMEAQQFEIRRLKHDLANHLAALLALPEEKRTAYIEGMLDNPAFSQVLKYSGDATVNAVLTAKESQLRQRDIRFYAKVDIPGELPFDKAQICALLSNALDNAAEACEKLPVSQREVEFTAKTGKGMLAVSVKNPCGGVQAPKERSPEAGSILPATTKADTKHHGFGLKSIREAVKKYGGNLEIEQSEGKFSLFCWLPLASDPDEGKTPEKSAR